MATGESFGPNETFSIYDYVIFGITLLISTLIGFWYAFRKEEGVSAEDEILLGGRRMPMIPTVLSLMTSFISGVALLAIPVEIYQYGATFFWFLPASIMLAAPITVEIQNKNPKSQIQNKNIKFQKNFFFLF